MSNITLSASVRQNLLSLQSTSQLLATTQNDLATGNKVNSALDNPTNYFTSQTLNSRASDISNLLDGIGNGVQVLQAANTGITSLKSLLDSAKSIANQALQASSGYSSKSQFSATITGATADNLLGTPTYTSANVVGTEAKDNQGTPADITTSTTLADLGTALTSSDSLTINGKNIAFFDSTASETAGTAANTTYVDIGTKTVGDLLSAIDTASGGTSSIAAGVVTLGTGTDSDLTIAGSTNALADLGLSAGSTPRTATSALDGKTLTIGATAGGTATSITFGTGGVKSLNDLNSALAANNLQATIDTAGKLTITTSNDNASATIGTIGGTATDSGSAFAGATAGAPVGDPNSQSTRANLVSQYNNVIQQIKTTAQDSSFNGVNLLNGDQLKLVFNETGSSTLNIQGNTDDPAGLGLSTLTSGTDFLDNSGTNKILTALNKASNTLDSQASALGSNLSIVQIRQDFSKNMINVLQTGASNLTLADPNEEAANSQALSTRQSIAVSALALANTSQQSVLRLLQ